MSTETESSADAAAADTAAMTSEEARSAAAAKPKRNGKGRRILLGLLVLGIAGGAYEGQAWWRHGRFIEKTDDAYVSARSPAMSHPLSVTTTAS